MATSGTEYVDATIANGIFSPDIWSKRVIVATESKLRFMLAVNRVFEKDATVGRLVNVPSIGELAARDKSEGTAIQFETLAETVVAITLNIWKYAAVGIEDIVKVQSIINLREQYQKKIGYALAKAQDTSLADLVGGFANNTGTLGTLLTDDDFLAAKQKLDEGDVPEDDRVWVLSPAEKINLLKINKWTSADYVNFPSPAVTGKVPSMYGSPILETTNLKKPAAGQGDNAYFHKEALAAVVQMEPTMHAFYDVRYFSWLIASQCIYGVKEMRDSFGYHLKGKA